MQGEKDDVWVNRDEMLTNMRDAVYLEASDRLSKEGKEALDMLEVASESLGMADAF